MRPELVSLDIVAGPGVICARIYILTGTAQ